MHQLYSRTLAIVKKLAALFVLCLCASGAHAQCSFSSYLGFQIPIAGAMANWAPCLNGDLTLIDSILGGTAILLPASTTPSVAGFTNWITANTGAVTITNFTSGFPGQRIVLLCGASDTYTALASNATLALISNWSCASAKSLTLVLIGTVWTETTRSILSASGPQYAKLRCEPGLGDGLNAVPAGTYLESTCYNDSAVTWTITGIKCFTDNNGSSTLNAAGNTLGALLTGAVTCTNSFASGTQSANVLLTSGDYIKFTFVSDGTSKQSTFVVSMTQ
jgi:hypothetical protein